MRVEIGTIFRVFSRLIRGRSTGFRGEKHAARYLCRKCGYTLLARNWRNPRNRREEIDLICLDEEVLVFVEVKTRTGGRELDGYYAVNTRKKSVLRRACRAFLRCHDRGDYSYRLDVVTVRLSGDIEIRHYRNLPLFS